MNATVIIALIAVILSFLTLVYTMAKDNAKSKSTGAAELAELKAALENRPQAAELVRLSAKIDFISQNCAETKIKMDALQNELQEERRNTDKRLALLEEWKRESDV